MIESEQLHGLKAKFTELLSAEGYRPKPTECGDITFKSEGTMLYLEFDADDPSYVRFLVPNWWSIESPKELRCAYTAASQVCHSCKGVKVSVHHDEKSVWVSVESLVAHQDSVQPALVLRQIAMINTGIAEFRSCMNQLMQAVDADCPDVVVH